jgi:tetratricopeptide (TPR) repeat protein
MQQYRVNYSLLIGLLVGTLVCSGAVYGLWKFQIERKSGWLITEAEKAREAGDERRAVEYYGQYLSIQNDEEVQIKYGQAFSALAKLDDLEPQEFHMAWQALEGITRDPELGTKPESDELRLQLAKMYALMQRFPDAIFHLDYLLEKDPKNEELHVLKASYLGGEGKYDQAIKDYYKLVGYDEQTESFDAQKAIAPHNTQVYTDLARLVRTRREDTELANRIMDQLVEVNPESAEAHLARGQFKNGLGDDENAGRADIEKAYQLKPEDADVLLNMAIQTARPAENAPEDEANAAYDKASEYLSTGKKLFPEDYRFYQVAGDVEIRRKNYDAALAQVDEGLKKIGTKKASMLLLFKADLQLNEQDMKGVEQTIDDMRRESFRSEFIDWYQARKMLAQEQWFPAKEALSRLRPRVAEDPNPWPLNLRDIDFYLGLCFERLGQQAEALDQYELVLDADPENESAVAGKTRVSAAIDPGANQADPLQEKIAKILQQPKDQQDWSEVDKMVEELGKKQGLDEKRLRVYRAQLLIMREEFDAAAKLLAEANRDEPDNLTIHRLGLQIARLNPKSGPEKALARWQQLVNKFGDQPSLRIDKADILIALHKENPSQLRAELAGLTEGVDSWTAAQKVDLWSNMAARYLTLSMTDEARQFWTRSAELQPHELPLRLQLFQLALLANDDAGMQDAQAKILEIVGDRDDSTWLYTEARRKLSLVKRGELGKEGLNEIRLLVNRALEQRKDWHELYLVNAEVELVAQNYLQALQNFDEAAARGLPNQMALAMYIELLARYGRFADAATQLERLPETSRQTLLGPLYTDILFRTNQVESALEQARLATEKDPDNAQNYYWYGQLLARYSAAPQVTEQQRTAALDKAVQALKRVVELQPEFADGWFFLINLYANQKNGELAQKTLRDAQLALVGDNLQMFLAKCYEALGRWFDAETMYRAVYETAPEEIARAQGLAAFYLGQGYQQPDRVLKAVPLLNQIMRAGAEGKIEKNDGNLHWARRMAAKALAGTGEYQNLLKAEKLLASNSQGGELLVQDKLELAHILSARPEPGSRKTAIALLQEVENIQPLDERSEIILGELYHATGNWRDFERQMDEVVASKFPQSAAAREVFARRLIARGDRQSVEKAIGQVVKLKELSPNSAATFDLTVRLANKLGRQEPARNELLRRQPKIEATTEVSPQLERAVQLFGNLFAELKDFDSAEKLYRALAARDPAKSYALAMFLGMHRNVDQCFELLNQIYEPKRISDVLGVALSVVRDKRDQIGDKYDATVQGWLDRGLLDNPDSITLLMLQADLFDIQKRYSDAAAIYRKLLGRSELTGTRRAVVLNNLSFLVSLEGSAAGDVDPLKLANEAAEILGPSSDILDTRAVAYMAKGQYSQAIVDLRDAITDNPTATKYFHLAQAYWEAGEKKLALEAWTKAEELGLSKEVLNRMEHDKYEKLKQQIEILRRGGASVTQSATRRAG